MRRILKRHPDSHCVAASSVEVEITRPRPNRLRLLYNLTGKISDLRIPPIMKPARSDQLWRHTCFEAFLRASSGAEYYEFNFSPSTQWSAFCFRNYRAEMSMAEVEEPSIEIQLKPDRLSLSVSLELDALSNLARGVPWRLGLSALIENVDDQKSYWALNHPPGKPDFHHQDGFAHELSQIGRAHV